VNNHLSTPATNQNQNADGGSFAGRMLAAAKSMDNNPYEYGEIRGAETTNTNTNTNANTQEDDHVRFSRSAADMEAEIRKKLTFGKPKVDTKRDVATAFNNRQLDPSLLTGSSAKSTFDLSNLLKSHGGNFNESPSPGFGGFGSPSSRQSPVPAKRRAVVHHTNF
jgi:hypothetical protein